MKLRRAAARLGLFPVLAACPALVACDGQQLQQTFAEDARRTPSGVTRTSAQGAVAERDDDDWRTSPVYAGRVRVAPAFPNPVTQTAFVSVPVTVLDFAGVSGGLTLHAYDTGGRLRVLAAQTASAPGTYVLSFPGASLGRVGLTRVFVLDGRGEIVSYGDIDLLG